MKIDVKHIATLANLPLNPSEEEKLASQLEETLAYVDQLSEIDTKKVNPTFQVTGLENVFRIDETQPSLSQKEALQNAKHTEKGMFKVDAILEE